MKEEKKEVCKDHKGCNAIVVEVECGHQWVKVDYLMEPDPPDLKEGDIFLGACIGYKFICPNCEEVKEVKI